MPKVILAEQGKSNGSGVTLMGIEVTTQPDKTSYLSGDSFDTTGMVVTATYGNGYAAIAEAEVGGYTFSPSTLTDGVTSVTISYAEGGDAFTATVPVTVTHRLTSLTVTTQPSTLTYEYDDTLSTSGMVVQAAYTDNATATITSYTCSPTKLTTVGTQVITVSYTENNVTMTDTFSVTVNRKSVAKPTWKSNLTYSGSAQSVTSTTYWNNYDTTYMSMSGTTSATNAGTYSATFTLGSNYRWTDGTTTAISVNWTIDKATGSLSLSATTASIDGTNYSDGVAITVTRLGDGTITATTTDSTACPVSVSGTTVTIKGDGSTAGTYTVTISVAEGTNYTAPESQTVEVTILYWEWGTETDIGDETWWEGLKNWATNATAEERAAVVGKTKRTSLSTSVLGSSAFLMKCVGADQDGEGTLAFNAVYAAYTATTFGSSAVWIGSSARSYCQQIYNYCSAKSAIKTVSKGTCPSYNNSRAASVTYNDETVFLLSEREYGLNSYSPISTANSSTTKAECTYGYNASYTYYSSNSTRIMYRMSNANATAASSNYAYQWERSRYYRSNSTGTVCRVSNDGTADYVYYSNSYALAPAFVVG